jgi:oxidoreductase family protein
MGSDGQTLSDPSNDVPPVALPPRPTPPRPEDCCGSGCVQCIYAVYDDALLAWERDVERLLADAKKPV